MTPEGVYIKDLRIFDGVDLKDIIIVDNAVYSFGYQIDNGVPIVPYYDDCEDEELKHLTSYLETIVDVYDVREQNKIAF